MDGMALPQGNRNGPNCGVTAVAAAAGITFDEAWCLLAAEQPPRRPRERAWKGGTTVPQRLAVLSRLGVPYRVVFDVTGGGRRCTVATFARFAKPGKRYMVRSTRHVQLIRDGVAMDQGGPVPIEAYRCRRDYVTHAIELED